MPRAGLRHDEPWVRVNPDQGGMAPSEWNQCWMEFTPMARVGELTEIAFAVIFLASKASSFFTGSNLVMDGGYTSW